MSPVLPSLSGEGARPERFGSLGEDREVFVVGKHAITPTPGQFPNDAQLDEVGHRLRRGREGQTGAASDVVQVHDRPVVERGQDPQQRA